ncbi:MAG: holo-ACP synthase [Epsilonproteobacteria bacterium]|nr:holo-ACP synthase [Campylobacterota bacterium]
MDVEIKSGIDIIVIDRIKRSKDKFKERFLNRVFSKKEQNSFKKIETIAGYWAAKEAFSKALGVGIGNELSFLDIEIKKDSKNRPYFNISQRIREKFGIIDSSLSISHDGGFSIASVIIICQRKK